MISENIEICDNTDSNSDYSVNNECKRLTKRTLLPLGEFYKNDQSSISQSILGCHSKIKKLFEKKLNQNLIEKFYKNYTQ